jgi:lysophospholipase L1-like esterase
MSENRTLLKKIIFSLLPAAFFFLVAECALRLAGFQYTAAASSTVGRQINLDQEGMQRDPDLSWSWIPLPGADRTIEIPRLRYSFQIHFNSSGYRGPLLTMQRIAGRPRILAMGDSCTMGWGVPDDKTYSYRLQQILNKKASVPIEVMNGGILGYSSFQGLHEFSKRTIRYHPDVVIICYNWNDHLPALGVGTKQDGALTPTPDKFLPRFSLPSRFMAEVSNFRVTEFIEYLLARFGIFAAINQHHHTGATQTQGIVVRVALPDFEKNLSELIEKAREEKIIPILMTEPSAAVIKIPLKQLELKKYYRLQDEYNQAIRETAAKEGVILIDVARDFREEKSDLFLDLIHPNVKGHARVAQQIAAVVAPIVRRP